MQEIKRIAIIEPVGSHGGMNYYDYGLAYGLGANNLEVLYYSCNETEVRYFKNVTLIRSFKNLWHEKGLKKLYCFFLGYSTAFKDSKQNGIKIIHLHFFDLGILNLIVLILSKFYSQKLIVTLHDVDPLNALNGKSNIIVESLCYKLVDGIIVHNHSSKSEFLKKRKIKVPLRVIPHGNYLPFVKKLPLPVEKAELNLLFFGLIKDVKGLDVLIEAMGKVITHKPNIKLTIAGRPWKTEISKYIKLIQKNNLQDNIETHFRFIEDKEIDDFFMNADILVLPYKRVYQSGVLLLTMSYGRAAIVSNLEPFTEIVRDSETAFIFKSENSDDLASCILNISFDKIISITNNANQIIEKNFDWKDIGSLTKNFYSSLL
jgi:glycosyltransferase involved in cell wall biosynthesis